MRKQFIAFALVCALLFTLAGSALAAAAPRVVVEKKNIDLHPGEEMLVTFSLRNPGETKLATVSGELTDKKLILEACDAVIVDDTHAELTVRALPSVAGKATLKETVTLSTGKKFTFDLVIRVADNFAPSIYWSLIQYNEETGYPQIKLSMKDDFGMSNICYVREWTDEQGVAQSEIYDIISLYDKTEAVIFRTLDKPGVYSVQINDNNKPDTGRYNSKPLITLVDTDANGVADAFYTDDATMLTPFQVEGGLTTQP